MPQTKRNNLTQLCQLTLTPCWDVNGCRGHSTLYPCMSGHPPQPKGPSETRRAFRQSTITRAHGSLQKKHNLFYSAFLTSPYDLLLEYEPK